MFFSLSDLFLNIISKKNQRLPWDFNARTYARLYPDMEKTGLKPRSHYRNIGLPNGHPYKNIPSRICRKFDKAKKTILVIIDGKSPFSCHIEHFIPLLAERFNILLVIASGYEHCAAFAPFCYHIVFSHPFFHSRQRPSLWAKYIKRRIDPVFALVDSVRCPNLVRALHVNDVATLFLLGTPFEPLSKNLVWTMEYATRIIYANKASADYITHEYMYGIPYYVDILPHFFGIWQAEQPEEAHQNQSRPILPIEKHDLPSQYREGGVFILGQGAVVYENGVDIFIKVAQQCHLLQPNFPLQFIWIDDGTQGSNHYRKVFEWMIDEAELYGFVQIVPASSIQSLLPHRGLIFLDTARFSSRTGAAHAMLMAQKPVIGLEGVAPLCDVLHQTGLGTDYLFAPKDIEAMAHLVLREARKPTCHLSQSRREAALLIGDAQHYCNRLIEIGSKAAQDRIQETEDVHYLLMQKNLKKYYLKKGKASKRNISLYVRNWRSGIYPLRPFAGFHPGIYALHHDLTNRHEDPLVHYLKSGCPQGVWNWQVIDRLQPISTHAQESKIALHIHAHYPEMVGDMMRRLMVNKIRPSLFISVHHAQDKKYVEQIFGNYPSLVDIRIVPNRGRDIGPFLSEFGQELINQYDIIGHIHTKKSEHITDRASVSRLVRFLMVNLLGDGKKLATADTIIEKMVASKQDNKPIGFVFPDEKMAVGWVKNRKIADRIAWRLGIGSVPDFINFSLGTMFWISKEVLKPFVDLHLEWEDYPPEPLTRDGTILHAMERLFAVVAEDRGFSIASSYFDAFKR